MTFNLFRTSLSFRLSFFTSSHPTLWFILKYCEYPVSVIVSQQLVPTVTCCISLLDFALHWFSAVIGADCLFLHVIMAQSYCICYSLLVKTSKPSSVKGLVLGELSSSIHVSWIFIELDRTVIPCNVLPLMDTVNGHNSKRSVHTEFANKHMNSFDMWFKLIGLPTHVRTIIHNHWSPAVPFSPLYCVFSDIKQVFPSKNIML